MTDWKQLLENRREKLADNSDFHDYYGILKGHASLEPLLLKALERLNSIANEDYRGNRPQSAISAYNCLEEIKAELEKK